MARKTLTKKNLVISLLTAVLFLATVPVVLAIEINYPQIPGVEAPQDFLPKIGDPDYPNYPKEQTLPLFVKYLYALGLVAATILTTISLIYGGLLYLLSGSHPGKMAGAKDQITAAFLGLGLLLMSYLFLNILNPNLLVMRLPAVTRPNFPLFTEPLLPGEQAQVFWEIPIATIVSDISSIYPRIKPASQDVEDKADIVEQTAQYLTGLLNSCSCGNLSARCDAVSCIPSACANTAGGTAQRSDLCTDLLAIEARKQDLADERLILNASRKNLAIVKFNLQKETTRLQVAEALMKSCTYVPIDLNTLLGLKQTSKIEVKKPWSEINMKNNPLTFYCQIEDSFVEAVVREWRTMVREMEAELTQDPYDIPDPPPSSGAVCPNGACEIGENYNNCQLDCPTPPPAGLEAFPFEIPLPSAVISQLYGANPQNYGGRGHNGIDFDSYLDIAGQYIVPVNAAAAGRVVGIGDLSSACPACSFAPNSGYDYGVWLAIEHQVFYQNRPVRFVSFYSHLLAGSVLVIEGQNVARGERIATMDNTGCSTDSHLHFGLYLSNFRVVPETWACNSGFPYPSGSTIDPLLFLKPI